MSAEKPIGTSEGWSRDFAGWLDSSRRDGLRLGLERAKGAVPVDRCDAKRHTKRESLSRVSRGSLRKAQRAAVNQREYRPFGLAERQSLADRIAPPVGQVCLFSAQESPSNLSDLFGQPPCETTLSHVMQNRKD